MYFTFITVRDHKINIEVGWRKIKQSKKIPCLPPKWIAIFLHHPPPPIFFRYISEPPPPPLPSPFRQPN